MESIIADNLTDYLLRNNLIIHEHFGFLLNRSTCTQLLSVFNFCTFECDQHNRVNAAYIDFAKAFDFVSHKSLFKNAKLKWIASFLSNQS